MKNSSNGVACALFEADGGAWKFRAVHEIAVFSACFSESLIIALSSPSTNTKNFSLISEKTICTILYIAGAITPAPE